MKVARTVRTGGKVRDYIKDLPIGITYDGSPERARRRFHKVRNVR